MASAQLSLFVPAVAQSAAHGNPKEGRLAIYLAGPMTGVADSEALEWREEFRLRYGDEFDVRIPQDHEPDEDLPEGPERWAKIAQGERKAILNCDATIAYVPRPSMGTAMGIMYAYLSGRTVVVVRDEEDERLSRMVRFHSHGVCENFDDAVRIIRQRHSRRTIETVRRRDGTRAEFDHALILDDIEQAVALSKQDAREELQEHDLDPIKLANAVLMHLEDILAEDDRKRHLFKTDDVASVIEKVLMDNSHRAEVHTVAKTYIQHRERRHRRRDLDEISRNFAAHLTDFLHDVKANSGNIRRMADGIRSLVDGDSEVDRDRLLSMVDGIIQNQAALSEKLGQTRHMVDTRYQTATVSLSDFILAQCKRFRDQVEFDIDIPEDLIVELRTSCLESILAVLIDNSIKYGFEGARGRISISAQSIRDRDLVLKYWNDGKPLTREIAEFIFNQGGSASEKGGWKWGLSQVRRYVDEMGGHIACVPVREVDGTGTKATLQEVDEGPPLFRITLDDCQRDTLQGRRILVVDDSDLDREMIARILRKGGFTVEMTADPNAALEIINEGGLYGAVLDVDLRAGQKNGFWVLERLRDARSSVRAVVVSSGSSMHDGRHWQAEADRLGAYRTFDKERYSETDILSCFI